MSLFRQQYRAESTRLQNWDYSWPWWYFVTIVTKGRQCDFGRVESEGVRLSDFGSAVDGCWQEIPRHHDGVELDDYVIMPNHIHGIIILGGNDRRDVQLNVSTEGNAFSRISPKGGSLSVVVRTFKAAVTLWARKNGQGAFRWQERFFDHIIRNDADLQRIREYILNNPLQWALDEENPSNVRPPR